MSRIIEIEVKNLDQVQRLWAQYPVRTKAEIRKALNISAILIQRHARQESPVDKGTLRSSIHVRYLQDAVVIAPGVKYAIHVHEGTGVYGPHKAPIRPKRARVLAWRSGGRWHFARQVRGVKPNPFMARAAKSSTPGVNAAFAKAVDNITRAA
jgi:hypothetical protein